MDNVDTYRRVLALRGHYLDASSKILDFGCGAGALVLAFREAGFDAHGFDIHDYLTLRERGERRHFTIASIGTTGRDNSEFALDWARYSLPFADGTFDFVCSDAAMEHVQNHDAVLAELARVMRPGGIAVHIFPPRYMPIEPHTNVPFGGLMKARWYYRLWAALGVRNEFQKAHSAAHVADLNARYARTGTNYLSLGQLREVGLKHFHVSHFDARSWHAAQGAAGWRMTRPALIAYTLFKQTVWVLERPRHETFASNAAILARIS